MSGRWTSRLLIEAGPRASFELLTSFAPVPVAKVTAASAPSSSAGRSPGGTDSFTHPTSSWPRDGTNRRVLLARNASQRRGACDMALPAEGREAARDHHGLVVGSSPDVSSSQR